MKKYMIEILTIFVLVFLTGFLVLVPAFAQSEITVSIVANPLVEDIIVPNLSDFEKETGIKVNIDALPWGSLYQKQILEVTGRTGAYDVMLLDDVWIEQYNQAGMLLPLNEFFDENTFPDKFFPSMWELGMKDGNQYVIPQRINVFGLVYWKTPFEELGLSVPQTWDEFLDVTKILTTDDRYGVSLALALDGSAHMTWVMLLYSAGKEIFDQNWEPMINSVEGVEALELLVELAKYSPPGSVSWRWAQARSALSQGIGVMHLGGISVIAELNTPEGSDYPGEFEIAPTPAPKGAKGGKNLFSTYAWAIASDTRNAEAAWEFIKWITGPEMERKHGLSGSSRPVESAQYSYYQDPQVLEARPLASKMRKLLPNSFPQPRIAIWQQISNEIAVEINEAILGQKSAKQALDDANDRVRELLLKKGYIKQ